MIHTKVRRLVELGGALDHYYTQRKIQKRYYHLAPVPQWYDSPDQVCEREWLNLELYWVELGQGPWIVAEIVGIAAEIVGT